MEKGEINEIGVVELILGGDNHIDFFLSQNVQKYFQQYLKYSLQAQELNNLRFSIEYEKGSVKYLFIISSILSSCAPLEGSWQFAQNEHTLKNRQEKLKNAIKLFDIKCTLKEHPENDSECSQYFNTVGTKESTIEEKIHIMHNQLCKSDDKRSFCMARVYENKEKYKEDKKNPEDGKKNFSYQTQKIDKNDYQRIADCYNPKIKNKTTKSFSIKAKMSNKSKNCVIIEDKEVSLTDAQVNKIATKKINETIFPTEILVKYEKITITKGSFEKISFKILDVDKTDTIGLFDKNI